MSESQLREGKNKAKVGEDASSSSDASSSENDQDGTETVLDEDDADSDDETEISASDADEDEAPSYSEWLKDVMSELDLRYTKRNTTVAAPTATTREGQAQGRAAPQGRGKTKVPLVSQALRDALFGDPDDRQSVKPEIRKRLNEQVALGRAAPVLITSSNGNKLSGNFFSHDGHQLADATTPDTTRPVVLFLSGSGGSAEDYGTDMAEFYQESGASVLAANYGGYGKYDDGEPRPEPTEQSVLEDAQSMLQHLLDLGYTSDQIIIHGFSLGGAIAGKLQAHNEASSGTDAGSEFRGLVMDRPMMSSTSGVKGNVDNQAIATLGGALTRKLVGSMSASKAMAASASTTPLVIGTEKPTRKKGEDADSPGTGAPKPNRFALQVDGLRSRMQAAAQDGDSGRSIEGVASTGNHFDHEAAIRANGDHMKALINKERDGTPSEQPEIEEVAPSRATSQQLRKLIARESEKRAAEVEAIRTSAKQLFAQPPTDDDETAAALDEVERGAERIADAIDELSEMRASLLRIPNEEQLVADLDRKVNRALTALAFLTAENDAAGELKATMKLPAGAMTQAVAEMRDARAYAQSAITNYERDKAKKDFVDTFNNASKKLETAEGKRVLLASAGGTWTGGDDAVVQAFTQARTQFRLLPHPAPTPRPTGLKGLLTRLPKPGRRAVPAVLGQ